MSVKKGQTVELDVVDLALGGRGLARVNGMAVFVDQAVPGDRVRARIVKKRRSYAEARVVELLSPSVHRVKAPCPYSGICGGCKWQFLDYETQILYKRQHVADALRHIGLLDAVCVHAVLPSGQLFHYRNKMEFTCSDRRWLMPEELGREDLDTDFALGLHVPGTFDKVLDTRACLLQPDLGNAILGDVRTYMKESPLPVYGLKNHVGFWRFLMLRHSPARDQWMVNLITAAEATQALLPLADLLTRRYPQVVSVVNNITARRAGIAVGESEITLRGTGAIVDCIGPFSFEISANSFFQTNTAGARRLYETVREFARLKGDEHVLDLYSGTGTIAIWLSPFAAQVTGLEIVASAVADAENNCRRNRIANVRFELGDILQRLPAVSHRPQVLVVDPPRAGLHKKVVRQVLDMVPPRIVYVSCNPATLARDIALLKECYRVAEVQPVDMFPHTYHIEAVARLERTGA